MMNKFSVVAFALMLVFAATFVSEVYAQKPIKGTVVSLNDLVLSGTGKVTKEQAQTLADNGNPIVFKVGKKIYFVYNEDGTFAGKRLAKYANNEFVGIVGKTKKVKGIDIIIMNTIDGM